MRRMKEAAVKALFALCHVPNGRGGIKKHRWHPAYAPLTDAHLYARLLSEAGYVNPRWSNRLLSTPQGLGMGTGPERPKNTGRGGWGVGAAWKPPSNNAGMKKRTVPNASQWGALMFDSWMIPRGDLFLPPTATAWKGRVIPEGPDKVKRLGTICRVCQNWHLLMWSFIYEPRWESMSTQSWCRYSLTALLGTSLAPFAPRTDWILGFSKIPKYFSGAT